MRNENVRSWPRLVRELHLDRDHARRLAQAPGDGGGAVLLDGAHGVGGRHADLPGLVQAREDRIDVRLLHGELRGPEVVERMAERVDAVVVDVRDGAGDREVHVAFDQGDAQRAARPAGRAAAPGSEPARPPVPITGVKPMAEKIPRAHSKVAGSKPEKTRGSDSGVSDGAGKAARRGAAAPGGAARSRPAQRAGAARPRRRRAVERCRRAARAPGVGVKRAEAARGASGAS